MCLRCQSSGRIISCAVHQGRLVVGYYLSPEGRRGGGGLIFLVASRLNLPHPTHKALQYSYERPSRSFAVS